MSYPLRKRFRVSLRTLLLLVTVSAVAAALVSRFYFRPGPTVRITTHAAWDNATKNGQCVVFVDGGWNTNMAAFGIPFGKFADWCHTHTKTRTLTMMIQNDDDAVFGICDQLWRTNNIPLRGMKHYGGAGRVLWIDDGKVVDYAWCMDFLDFDDLGNIDELIARTQDAFD